MKVNLLSIIVPVRNEERYISKCLDRLFLQDVVDFSFEVLIVDGMSIDNTRQIIRRYEANYNNLFLIDNPSKIVPTGMNLALKQAKGEIIIRVDGHCIIATDYVRKCVEYLKDNDIAGVGGPMETIGETKLSESIAIAMSSKFGVGGSSFRTEKGKTKFVDSIPFPAYRKEIITRVGFYDEELIRNQDDEYNYRIREIGGKLLLAADVNSTYYSRGSLKKLWKQYFQYGFWKVRVLQKHPKQMSLRQFVPPIFVGGLMASLILALFTLLGRYLLIIILLAYLAANIGSSIFTSAKKGWHNLFRLPIIFSILHVSYGLGFLVGVVKFANRWGDKVGKVPAL